MTRPDERWFNGDTGEPYWRESTAHEDRWIVVHATPEPPQPAQEAPGRPKPARAAAVPDATPILVTRAQRIRNLIAGVRSGDHSAADVLRRALAGDDDAA